MDTTRRTDDPSAGLASREDGFATACKPLKRWQEDMRSEHRLLRDQFKATWDGVVVRSKYEIRVAEELRLNWQQRMMQDIARTVSILGTNAAEMANLHNEVQQLFQAVEHQSQLTNNFIAEQQLQQQQEHGQQQEQLPPKLKSPMSTPFAEASHVQALEMQQQQQQQQQQKRVGSEVTQDTTAHGNHSADHMNVNGIEAMVDRIVKQTEGTIVDRLDEVQQMHMSRLDDVLEDSTRTCTKLDEMLNMCLFLEATENRVKSTQELSNDPLQHFGKLSTRSLSGPLPTPTATKSLSRPLPSPTENGLVHAKSVSSLSRKNSNMVKSFNAFAASKQSPESQETQDGITVDELNELYELGPSENPVQKCLRYIQTVSFVLVILNTIFMGISIDVSMPYAIKQEQAPAWLNVFERGFIAVFCLELVMRLVLEKLQFFKGPNRWWNLFDSFIVSFQLLEQLQLHDMENTTFMRVFRITRIVRAARALRTMKSMRIIRLLMCGEVWQPLVWGFGVMFAMIYLFAILVTTIVTNHAEQNKDLPPRLLDLYGSVSSTMLTLYMAISFGEPWEALMRPLDEISSVMRILFVIYVIIISLGLQNALAAVFVDGLTHVSNHDRDITMHERNAQEKMQLRELRELLLCQPLNADGKIARLHLVRTLTHEGAYMLKKLGLELSVAITLFLMLDTDDQQSVEIDEFVYGLMNLKGNSTTIQLANLMYHSKQ